MLRNKAALNLCANYSTDQVTALYLQLYWNKKDIMSEDLSIMAQHDKNYDDLLNLKKESFKKDEVIRKAYIALKEIIIAAEHDDMQRIKEIIKE